MRLLIVHKLRRQSLFTFVKGRHGMLQSAFFHDQSGFVITALINLKA